MPVDEDKYPTESGRRRFVKGVVGSAALGSLSVGAGASINAATSAPGAGGGPTEYVGVELVDGPAPRAMPIVPIEIQDGELYGRWPDVEERTVQGLTEMVAETELAGGVTYSSTWFQYCGVQQYTGAQPDADANNALLARTDKYDWASDLEAGTPLQVENFSDYEEWGNGIGQDGLGKPVMADWRTTEEGRPLPVQVIRTPQLPRMIDGEGRFSSLSGDLRSFIDEATDQDFLAFLDKCTHFCCVPGFKTSDYPGAADSVYCQCHQSIYDPFSPVNQQFVALPRPD